MPYTERQRTALLSMGLVPWVQRDAGGTDPGIPATWQLAESLPDAPGAQVPQGPTVPTPEAIDARTVPVADAQGGSARRSPPPWLPCLPQHLTVCPWSTAEAPLEIVFELPEGRAHGRLPSAQANLVDAMLRAIGVDSSSFRVRGLVFDAARDNDSTLLHQSALCSATRALLVFAQRVEDGAEATGGVQWLELPETADDPAGSVGMPDVARTTPRRTCPRFVLPHPQQLLLYPQRKRAAWQILKQIKRYLDRYQTPD